MKWLEPVSKALAVSFLMVQLLVVGCGGGTRGTGIGENATTADTNIAARTLIGVIKGSGNANVSGIRILLVETGESVQTDENGGFSFQLSEFQDTEATLQVSLLDGELVGVIPFTGAVERVEIDITNRIVVVVGENGDYIQESELTEL